MRTRGLAGGAIILLAAGLLAACGQDQSAQQQPTAIPLPTATAAPSPSALPISGPEPTPIPDGYRVIIDSPDASATIQSPVEVIGTASVEGGNVVVVVLDAAGNELGRATATASAAAPAYGHFDVNVNFDGATSGARGQIKVLSVPRGSATPWNYYIEIRFK